MAIKIPVTEELIQRSPSEISENGIANSTNPKATMAVLCSAKERSAPRCRAMGSNINAASSTRQNARVNGETSCTATLMKK